MKIIFEKTKVYDLKIDVAKTNLCIGDDLEIDVDAKGALELFYFKEIGFINRFLGRKNQNALGCFLLKTVKT